MTYTQNLADKELSRCSLIAFVDRAWACHRSHMQVVCAFSIESQGWTSQGKGFSCGKNACYQVTREPQRRFSFDESA